MSTSAYREEIKTKVTFGVWGFIIGAVVAMIIGFKWGGWTTSGTTEQMTQEAVLASQVASQAAICVAQFIKDPNHQEKLQELGKLSSYQRSTFIEKGGWDKMPGEETAGYAIARACADGLEVLLKK